MIATNSVTATLTRNTASRLQWDVGIIGAGVAGASLAVHLARQGRSVLLIESQRFPREKVCGGCLNQRAIASLGDMGVLSDCLEVGAVEIENLSIRQGMRKHRWSIPKMLSMRRSVLDSILVSKAIAHGAGYLDQTFASIDSAASSGNRDVILRLRSKDTAVGDVSSGLASSEPSEQIVHVGVAVVAAGLTRSPLTQREAWPARTESYSRIGVQALVPAELLEDRGHRWSEAFQLEDRNDLRMLIGTDGYLGVSRTDGGFYDFAAALDPTAIASHRSIGGVVDNLLRSCSLPSLSEWIRDGWKSTPHLTRRSWPVARDRIFLLGDSMGYVEPFTGEGMSWAMAGARWLSECLHDALADSDKELIGARAMTAAEDAWNDWAGIQRRRHQSICRWVASQVRHPSRTAWVLRGLDWIPPVRNILLRKATQ